MDCVAATRLLRHQPGEPKRIVNDGLGSYPAALEPQLQL